MVAIHRTDSPPGPAGRWFIDRLKQAQAPPLKRELSRPQPVSVAAKASTAVDPVAGIESKAKTLTANLLAI
jgi:hypothetical protein